MNHVEWLRQKLEKYEIGSIYDEKKKPAERLSLLDILTEIVFYTSSKSSSFSKVELTNFFISS